MWSFNTHLALLALLLGAQEGESYRRRGAHHPHQYGRGLFSSSPAFISDSMADAGGFLASRWYPRGGGSFTSSAGPLLDVFQEVMGDIKKVARELSDSTSATRTPSHQVVETSTSATLTADLPGCKREDVDAKVSEDGDHKTLTITAVRKRLLLADGEAVGETGSSSPRGSDGKTAPPSAAASAASAAVTSQPAEKETPPTSSPSFKEERFELSFRVGDEIDVSGIRGNLEDGMLTLVLPKQAPEPPADPIEIPIDFDDKGNSKHEEEKGRAAASREAGARGRKETDEDASANTHISLS